MGLDSLANGHWYRRLVALGVGAAVLLVSVIVEWQFSRINDRHTWVHVLFSDAELTTPIASISSDVYPSLDANYGVLRPYRDRSSKWSPFVRWDRVRRVTYAEGYGYVSANAVYARPWQIPRVHIPLQRAVCYLISAFLSAIATYLLLPGNSLGRIVTAAALLRTASLSWLLGIYGFFTIHAGDETRYMYVARKLLDPDTEVPQLLTTLGNPALYLLVMVFKPDINEFWHTGICSAIYFLIFGIGAVCGLVWLVGRWGGTLAAARATAILLPAYPWLMRCYHKPDGLLSYLGVRLDYPVIISRIEFYYMTDLIGFNAMSDTPAMAMGLLSLALFYRAIRDGKGFIVAAVVCALSCMLRVTNVLYGITFALILLCIARRIPWRMLVVWCVGFLVAYLPQFLWNQHHFGSPLRFGYGGQANAWEVPTRTFGIKPLLDGIDVTVSMHHQLLLASGLCLWCLRRHYPRLVGLIATLVGSMFVFYTAFVSIDHNPVRYVLMPLTIMAGLPALLWLPKVPADTRHSVLLCLAALLVFVPGESRTAFLQTAPKWLPYLYWLVVAAAIFITRKRFWPVLVVADLAALGDPYITFLGLAVVAGIAIGGCLWHAPMLQPLRQRYARPQPLAST